MQTINNRMTETQIADLFSLAVQLQVKAEESDDRDTAILAYSIQNACSNLTESQREFRAADATIHNLELKITDMAVQLANAESKCRELAAENVGQKSGVTYFAFAPEYGFDYFSNKQDAIDIAQAEIDAYRDDAFDGWDEDVRRVSWGIVIQQADGFDAEGVHISDSRHTYQTCDYQLVDMVKTPATDAFLAEVRAQGVEMFSKNAEGAEQGNGLMKAIARRATKFAAQLRKGVRS